MSVMERRGEPRFPITSTIRVIVPGRNARTIDSTLIDISATGMRFLIDEALDPEYLVAIEVDSRLILTEVRYCQPRGERFVVGARRLHEIAKDEKLSDGPAVVAEMLGHLRRHITAGDAQASEKIVAEALEKIVERRENPEIVEAVFEHAPEPQEPEAPATSPEAAWESEDELVAQAEPEPEHEPEHHWHFEPTIVEQIPAHKQAPAPEQPVLQQPAPQHPALQQSALQQPALQQPALELKPEAPVPQFKLPLPAPASVDPLEAARRELSAHALRALAEQEKDAAGGRKWHVAVGLVAGFLLAAVLVFVFLQKRTEAKAADPGPVASSPAPAPMVAETPKPVVHHEIHHAQIRVLRPTWISLSIDDGEPSKTVVKKDELREILFSGMVVLRVADGSAVDITIDENRIGPLRSGQQVVRLTASGVQLVN